MTRLEEAIKNIVDVFLEYAGEDPKKPKLCQEDLQNMLENEIKDPEIKEKITANDIEEAMAKLDKNHDGEINFREYCRCVMDLAKALYQNKTGKGYKRGKGKGNEDGQED